MLILKQGQLAAMRAHAEQGFPHEICGILLGKIESRESPEKSVRRVKEVIQAANLNEERAADRYELDPKVQIQAEKRARELGWQVLGFYHSHPDHPCKASETDFQRSWEDYSYLIISVQSGKAADHACWIQNQKLRSDYFVEEEVQVEGDRF